MIQTFQQIFNEVQSGTQSNSATELVLIKRDANFATERFKSVMKRPWSRVSKKANVVTNQQDYQLPRSVLRPTGADYLYGSAYAPLIEIGSEQIWNALNATPSPGIGMPRFFFPKGKDVISIYPIPGTDQIEGLRVYYEPKQPRMIADDYSTGTVTVTNGSAVLTHSGTGFTADMVGRYFYITDAAGDGQDYQIVDYVDSSTLTLENYYEGQSASGQAFIIGVVPDIPGEYIPAITDYCYARFYFRRGNRDSGKEFMGWYQAALDECKEAYSSPTTMPNINNPYDLTINAFDVPPGTLT